MTTPSSPDEVGLQKRGSLLDQGRSLGLEAKLRSRNQLHGASRDYFRLQAAQPRSREWYAAHCFWWARVEIGMARELRDGLRRQGKEPSEYMMQIYIQTARTFVMWGRMFLDPMFAQRSANEIIRNPELRPWL